jgi:protein ImuB
VPDVTNPHAGISNPQPLIPTPLYACLHQPPALEIPPASLTAIAADFSPRYVRHGDDLVSIDVSGLERLIGLPDAIAEELRRDAASRGVRVHVGVAATRMAAVVLALARPGVTVVARGEQAAALAAIPIGVLEKIDAISDFRLLTSDFKLQTFTHWGLRTLGDLAVLPPADLVARLGVSARAWQAIARGEDLRPLIPTLPDERFESSLELEWPIDGLEPLSFVLTRLLEPLSTRLERRDRGAAVLHVLLGLVTRELYARRLDLPSPIRDVRTLRTLALLDLDAHPPTAAIDRVTIVIDPTPGRVLQHALFTRAHPTPEQLSALVARLGALMGQDRFGAPVAIDSYRPGAFAMRAFATDHEAGRAAPNPPHLPGAIASAMRRCRHPVPARVAVDAGRPARVTTDRRGFAGGSVLHCVGPWRSSGEWWKFDVRSQKSEVGSQTAQALQTSDFRLQTSNVGWDRDEWDVTLSDRAVYRIFRDREADAWFIDAIVD